MDNIERRKALNKARTARSSSFAERERRKNKSFLRKGRRKRVGAFHDGNGLYTEEMKKQKTSTSPMKSAICCWASHQSPPYNTVHTSLHTERSGLSGGERTLRLANGAASHGPGMPSQVAKLHTGRARERELPPERSPLLQLDLITGKLRGSPQPKNGEQKRPQSGLRMYCTKKYNALLGWSLAHHSLVEDERRTTNDERAGLFCCVGWAPMAKMWRIFA